MRYPEFLKKNGTIGLVAPSFGCATEPYLSCFEAAKKYFEKLGYSIEEGPNCKATLGIGKSNTPKACGDEINDFFLRKECDVIISAGGGETMCEDLPFIDFEGIKNSTPKWYLGYSDNTNLTFTLPTICDIAAVYGPCVGEFGMNPLHPAVMDAFSVLTGEKLTEKNYDGWESEQTKSAEKPFETYNINEHYRQIIKGDVKGAANFEGRFIGGCIDCLVTLVGTPFDRVADYNERYKEDGIVWFIEACDFYPMNYKRALWQLEQAGWFKNVKGFIVGRSVHYDADFDGFTMKDAVESILGKYNVPLIMDVDLGHMSPQMPFISGGYGKVSAVDNEITIKYELK